MSIQVAAFEIERKKTMNTKVNYDDLTFAAIVYDNMGREYRFHFSGGEWYVEERIYWHADFYKS
jgi:hypothetical protein